MLGAFSPLLDRDLAHPAIDVRKGLDDQQFALILEPTRPRAHNAERLGLSTSLNTVPVAIVVYDADGAVVEANQAAVSMLGLSKRDLIGARAEDSGWLILDSVDGAISVHPAIACIRSGQAIRGVLVRARRPGGADVWLQVDAVPDPDRDGAMAMLTDVTHLIARSRVTSRSTGDHIVDEVTDRLASARMEPRAILATVTSELSRLRPGAWRRRARPAAARC